MVVSPNSGSTSLIILPICTVGSCSFVIQSKVTLSFCLLIAIFELQHWFYLDISQLVIHMYQHVFEMKDAKWNYHCHHACLRPHLPARAARRSACLLAHAWRAAWKCSSSTRFSRSACLQPWFRFGLSHTPNRDHSFLTFTSEDTKDTKKHFVIKAYVFS